MRVAANQEVYHVRLVPPEFGKFRSQIGPKKLVFYDHGMALRGVSGAACDWFPLVGISSCWTRSSHIELHEALGPICQCGWMVRCPRRSARRFCFWSSQVLYRLL